MNSTLSASRSSWAVPALFVAGALVLLLAAYFDTWSALVRVWTESETFNHGFAIAPIAAWLMWRKRDVLASIRPRANWIGVVALGGCCALWLVANAAGVNVLAAVAVVAAIPSLFVACAGVRAAWAVAFPLLFLLFMVPAGEGLTPLLMEGTADATVWAVRASGVPVYREGLHFMLPTGSWSVVEACSGLRYVIAAAVLSALFAYLNFHRMRARIVFVAVAITVALIANWVRAYLIVMIGHLSGMRLGVGDDHVWYGWIFFGITMFIVFWMGAGWKDETPPATAPRSGTLRSIDLDAAPRAARSPAARTLTIGVASLALLAMTPAVLGMLRDFSPRADVDDRLRTRLSGLASGQPALAPQFTGARTVTQGVLDPAASTDLYVAYFADQASGTEMIGFGNTVLDSADKTWKLVSRTSRRVQIDGAALPVNEWVVRSTANRRVLWTWYSVGGREAEGELRAKGLTALAILGGRGDHSAVVVIGTRLDDAADGPPSASDLDAARGRLTAAASPVSAAVRSITGP